MQNITVVGRKGKRERRERNELLLGILLAFVPFPFFLLDCYFHFSAYQVANSFTKAYVDTVAIPSS